MNEVESFLSRFDVSAPNEEIQQERDLIQFVATPATSDRIVQEKAQRVLDELVPKYIENRVQRLHKLILKLRAQKTVPEPVQNAAAPLRRAYEAMQKSGNRNDAAQSALFTTNSAIFSLALFAQEAEKSSFSLEEAIVSCCSGRVCFKTRCFPTLFGTLSHDRMGNLNAKG